MGKRKGAKMQAATVMVDRRAAAPRGHLPIERRKIEDLPDPPRAKWIAVHTEAGQEHTANFHLRQAKFWTFFPVEMRRVRHARRETDVKRAYLSRYVFVQLLPSQDWNIIQRLPGVSTVAYGSDGPLVIPDRQMAALLLLARPDGLVTRKPPPAPLRIILDPGDEVRVLDGPFAGCTGTVNEAGVDREGNVHLDLQVFRQPTPTTVPAGWVRKL
jgi:transcription antitermination factor NusG